MKKDNVTELFTPVSILVGSLIIAAAILFGGAPSAGTPIVGDVQDPAAAPTVDADSAKVDVKGIPFIGKANAPLTIAYWYDYQCSYCKRNDAETTPSIISEYVDSGKAKLVFMDMQFLGPDSATIGIFGRAVWEAAPDKFYAWHKAMMTLPAGGQAGWATDEKLIEISTSALGTVTANRALSLFKAKKSIYQEAIDSTRDSGTSIGIKSTPTTLVGKQLIIGAQPYTTVKAAIEEALKK